jgi:hypothetical protein
MVVVAAAFAITTAHALVLTVSHGLLFANPLVCNGNCAANLLNIVSPAGRISADKSLIFHCTRRSINGKWALPTSRTDAAPAFDCGVAYF